MHTSFLLVYPNRPESPVRVQITHRGKVYRKSIGLTAPTKSWRKERSGNQTIDSAIRLIRIGLESQLDELSTDKDILRALEHIERGKWIDDTIPRAKSRSRPSFWDYATEWAGRDNPAVRQRQSNLKTIADIMGDDDDWEDIDSSWCLRLLRECDKRGYSKNYQGTIIAKVKTIMSEGFKMKCHANEDFREFAKPSNEVDSVYLTESELDRIWDLELNGLEAKARDLLFLGCYSGGRWEDFSSLSADNIHGKELHYIQKKTGARVTLPLSPRIKAVLKRNGGTAPKMSDVVFNRTVKAVCLKAGVTERMQVRESRGDRYEHKSVPKWKMVSSHTCRRTLCTRLAQDGVPINQIMQISGHKSLASLQKYLRQSGLDTQKLLGKLEYFK